MTEILHNVLFLFIDLNLYLAIHSESQTYDNIQGIDCSTEEHEKIVTIKSKNEHFQFISKSTIYYFPAWINLTADSYSASIIKLENYLNYDYFENKD